MTSDPRIIRGVPVQPVTKLSLPLYLIQRLKDGGDKPLAIDGENESRRFSFHEVLSQSTRLSEALRSRGIGPGHVVAVCSENSIEFPIATLAAIFIGAACAPLNYNYTPRELEHGLKLSSPRAVFFTPSTQDALFEALKGFKGSRPLLVRMPDGDGDQEEGQGYVTLSQLINSVPEPVRFQPYKPADPSVQVALVLCSSGTTGLPKGVQLTHTNVLAGIANPQHPMYETPYRTTAYPGHLPLFHSFGLLVMLGAIAKLFTCVVMPYFSPHTFLRIIQDYKISSIPVVPPLMQLFAQSDLVSQYDISSLTQIACGAAPLSRELQAAVTKRLNVHDIRIGYGLTETTLGVLVVPNGKNKPGSSGCVVPGMEAKVIDESGNLLGPDERGELCFRGVLVMKGYVGDTAATETAIDSEGWLHTGDIGYYDKDGCFYVVDRLKELIKYKGFQVPPAELEALLQTHPGVADAAVIGLPNVQAGELPLAFVVRKDPTLTEQQVIEFVAKNVSPQKRLRGGVRFVEMIPKNPSGKILRRELRQLLKSKM